MSATVIPSPRRSFAGDGLRTSATAPTSTDGVDGDVWFQKTTDANGNPLVIFFGPKAAGAWPAGVSLGGNASVSSSGQITLYVTDFGARIDGKFVNDAAMTSGGNQITSTLAAFATADVGKCLILNGIGTSGATKRATITAVSGGVATIDTTSAATVTGQNLYFGTDDTPAWQQAIDTLVTAGGGTIFAHAGLSMIDGGFKTSASLSIGNLLTPRHYNAQITLPAVETDHNIVYIRLKGETPAYRFLATTMLGYHATNPTAPVVGNNFGRVSMLVTTRTDAAGYNTTNGWPSMIGGPEWYTSEAKPSLSNSEGWSNVHLDIEDLAIRFPANPNYAMVDCRLIPSMRIKDVNIGPSRSATVVIPSHPSGQAIMPPQTGNYEAVGVTDTLIAGVYGAVQLTEHMRIDGLVVADAIVALTAPQIDMGYMTSCGYISTTNVKYQLAAVTAGVGVAAVTTKTKIAVAEFSVEVGDAPLDPVYDVWDGGGHIYGEIVYQRHVGNWAVQAPSGTSLATRNIDFDITNNPPNGGNAGLIPPKWSNLTVATGFAAATTTPVGTPNSPRVRLNTQRTELTGQIAVTSSVSGAAGAAGVLVATIPDLIFARPAFAKRLHISVGADGSPVSARLYVAPSGAITYYGPALTAGSDVLALDGLSFSTNQ